MTPINSSREKLRHSPVREVSDEIDSLFWLIREKNKFPCFYYLEKKQIAIFLIQ